MEWNSSLLPTLLQLLQLLAMLRTPLGPRSGNSRRGPELTPYQRGRILGVATLGRTPTQIADVENCLISTIKSIIELDLERNDRQSKP